jgi:hypothetical protein
MYIHIHTYICLYIHANLIVNDGYHTQYDACKRKNVTGGMEISRNLYIFIYINTHDGIVDYMQIDAHTYLHIYIYIRIYTDKYLYMYMCIYIYIYTYVYTYIYIYPYFYEHILP